MKKLSAFFLFGAVALGFGAAREEMVYRTMVTVIIVPVIASLMVKTMPSWKRSTVMGMLGCAGLFWVFRSNPIFFILFFAATIILSDFDSGTKGAFVVAWIAVLGCAWLRHPDLITTLMQSAFADLKNGWGLLALGLSSGCLIYWFSSRPDKNKARTLLQFSFLSWFLLFSLVNVFVQGWTAASRNQSLKTTFTELDRMTGPFEGRVLGPSFLWFWKQDRVDDIGGILIDYFYSNQLRARACINRARPEILILDEESKRRYTRGTGSLETMVSVPAEFKGLIPATHHHPQLEVFKLDWSEK